MIKWKGRFGSSFVLWTTIYLTTRSFVNEQYILSDCITNIIIIRIGSEILNSKLSANLFLLFLISFIFSTLCEIIENHQHSQLKNERERSKFAMKFVKQTKMIGENHFFLSVSVFIPDRIAMWLQFKSHTGIVKRREFGKANRNQRKRLSRKKNYLHTRF